MGLFIKKKMPENYFKFSLILLCVVMYLNFLVTQFCCMVILLFYFIFCTFLQLFFPQVFTFSGRNTTTSGKRPVSIVFDGVECFECEANIIIKIESCGLNSQYDINLVVILSGVVQVPLILVGEVDISLHTRSFWHYLSVLARPPPFF